MPLDDLKRMKNVSKRLWWHYQRYCYIEKT